MCGTAMTARTGPNRVREIRILMRGVQRANAFGDITTAGMRTRGLWIAGSTKFVSYSKF
jgi:hypothetical protein